MNKKLHRIICKELNQIFKRNSKKFKSFRLKKLVFMIIKKQQDGGLLEQQLRYQGKQKEMPFKDKLIQKEISLMISSKKDRMKKAISKNLKQQFNKKEKKFNN